MSPILWTPCLRGSAVSSLQLMTGCWVPARQLLSGCNYGRQPEEPKGLNPGSVRLLHGRTNEFFDHGKVSTTYEAGIGQRDASDQELKRYLCEESV